MSKKRKGIAVVAIASLMMLMAGPAMAQEKAEPSTGDKAAEGVGNVLDFTFKLTGDILGMVGKLIGGIGEAFTDVGSDSK